MGLLSAALLGLVQGLTEFLPISSSGHVITAGAFVAWDAERFGLAFDVAMRVGTSVAALFAVGFVTSAMVGYLAYYRVSLAALTVGWLMWRSGGG